MPQFRAFSVHPYLALALTLLAGRARADVALPLSVTAAGGQQALSVFLAKGELMASSCAAPPCSSGAVSLGLPSELRGKPVRAEVVSIGLGRRAVVVSVDDGARAYRAVLAAPLAAGSPKVAFAGPTGLLSGEDGLRNGPMVQVSEADAAGVRRVLVGEQNEGVSLCGRATILAPRLLSAQDLELHAAKVQRLSVSERDRARQAKVTRLPDAEPSRGAASVLSTLAASSAIGSPQALTDGDPETTWSENVGGAGKGEFVVMRAPPELAISGLELTLRPKQRSVESGAAPQRLFIAGPRDVIEVTFPEDGWKNPGARYHVALEPALQSSCLALVLDAAFDTSAKAAVTVAEVSVMSELSAGALPELVAALAGGGQRAESAKPLLAAGGPAAFAAVASAFPRLDEGGRRVALEVMDGAPCSISANVYVVALTSSIKAQSLHAQSRLRRCGAAGGEALAQALSKVDKTDKRLMPLLVSELTLTDPARAVPAFLPLLDEKTVQRRRLLRTALAQAARTSAAEPAIRAALADPATPAVASIDLLRALGDAAPRYQPEAGAALTRLQAGSPALRSRYLLLGPSAVLARVSGAADASFRKSAAGDPDPHVRGAALALVRDPRRYQAELLAGLKHPELRVRESAVHALAVPEAAFAGAAVVERLEKDQWPLVRAAAADALARLPAGAALDKPLLGALDDDSALVRGRSIRALGERRAPGVADQVRERLVDADEWPEVRAEAARALGTLCDTDSVDELLAFAEKLADPMASPEAQLIGAGAVTSLGRLA
ncbi:MAG TPA: HEAT repeat domain-containing protein, partial [Polyangiaceae bacterium]